MGTAAALAAAAAVAGAAPAQRDRVIAQITASVSVPRLLYVLLNHHVHTSKVLMISSHDLASLYMATGPCALP